jgi:hypothetical protein
MGSVKFLGQQPGTEVPVLLNRRPFGLYVQLVSRGWGGCHIVFPSSVCGPVSLQPHSSFYCSASAYTHIAASYCPLPVG